jgi:signal peptidase I
VVFRGTDPWVPEASLPSSEGTIATAGHWVGSIVGLSAPDEKDFIKRVIGVGGDVVQCCDRQGRLTVNGRALDEPYVFEDNPTDQRGFGPITVPQGRLFVMGDHRGLSQDSRAYADTKEKGTIPVDQVIGRAFVTVWPVDHWRGQSVPPTFAGVPQAVGAPRPARRPAFPRAPDGAVAVLLVAAPGLVRVRPDGRRTRTLRR